MCSINLNLLIKKKNKSKAKENMFRSCCLIFLIICDKTKKLGGGEKLLAYCHTTVLVSPRVPRELLLLQRFY